MGNDAQRNRESLWMGRNGTAGWKTSLLHSQVLRPVGQKVQQTIHNIRLRFENENFHLQIALCVFGCTHSSFRAVLLFLCYCFCVFFFFAVRFFCNPHDLIFQRLLTEEEEGGL